MEMLHKFYRGYNVVRIGLAILFMLVMFGSMVQSFAHVIDIELPSPEGLRVEMEREKERDREAYERCIEGNPRSERDYERADRYAREEIS